MYDEYEFATPGDYDLITREDCKIYPISELEPARDFLMGIQEAVYQTGDVASLENYLEELCAILDCEFIAKRDELPKIEKRRENVS